MNMILESSVTCETLTSLRYKVSKYLQAWLLCIALLVKPIWIVDLVHCHGLRLGVIDCCLAGSGHECLSCEIDAMPKAACAVLDRIPSRNVL
jgi:hypothetical protein